MNTRTCIICGKPREDDGYLTCADTTCRRAIDAIPDDEIDAIRRREVIETLRAGNGRATYIHLTPKEQ